jgi:hypothetical protein
MAELRRQDLAAAWRGRTAGHGGLICSTFQGSAEEF